MTLKIQILQTLRRLFIILVGLTMTCLFSICICRHALMPNLIEKSWTVSNHDALSARPRKASKCHVQKNSCIKKQLCISMNDSLWTFLTCRLKRESRNIITMQIEPFFLFLHCTTSNLLSCSRHRTTKFANSESPIFTTKFLFWFFNDSENTVYAFFEI